MNDEIVGAGCAVVRYRFDARVHRCIIHRSILRTRTMGMFAGKIGLVMGVANDRSIAWAMSEALYAEGAELAFTHLPSPSSRAARAAAGRAASAEDRPALRRAEGRRHRPACSRPSATTYGRLDFLIHSIAFAPPQELRNPYVEMSREGWHLAMDISVYSLVAACRAAAPLMTDGGTIVTISYYGGEKVMPGYNVMGVCKAALEHSVRYLAWDLGRQKIRVNCISAGPMRTLSAAGIAGFDELREHAAQEIAAGPQRRARGTRHHRPLSA